MPIRMVKDEDGSSQGGPPGGGGGRFSGGGGGGGLIAILLSLLLRNPKLLLVVVIIGGAFYFFKGGCSGGGNLAQIAAKVLSTGANFDIKQYDKAEVFEPLAYDKDKNPLPERVSLQQYCPNRLNQGEQGSCVAWSSAYGARTILEARKTGADPNQVAFSPSFLYNQIKMDGCQGSYIIKAMKSMKETGALPFRQFPYTDQDCNKMPNSSEMADAEQYTMLGYNRLTLGGDDYTIDLNAIRQNLAQGAPVVIGMMVGGSFMQEMMGQKVWHPTNSDYSMRGFGGHAMCIVGYDDYLEGGAFQIMNSWGPEWGENGFGWVRYNDFIHFAKEAYGVYPMGERGKVKPQEFEVSVGLVDNSTKNYINLNAKEGNVFTTAGLVKKGTKFKIEVNNSLECYTYVFQDSLGKSTVLFPYTSKHSPYCGITGARLFPKDYSMQIDEVGGKDIMAVVITQKPLDFASFNKEINSSAGGSYAEKLKRALGNKAIATVNFSAGQKVSFSAPADKPEAAVAVIIEILK
ncbi:C1 family peptidase [Solitalea sp. MAHUQ-68]|uniref:C1 family peptidase n=1 Tax=Solitalea agri TaxID=2953739 RepID=A0A9X2JBR6_9SPHI|nr:C1 family peptidase [Solitalea agri]MCO4292762.1 C1 family peptidase [Solitalea agri]